MTLHAELQCITERGLTGMMEGKVNISMTSGNSTMDRKTSKPIFSSSGDVRLSRNTTRNMGRGVHIDLI